MVFYMNKLRKMMLFKKIFLADARTPFLLYIVLGPVLPRWASGAASTRIHFFEIIFSLRWRGWKNVHHFGVKIDNFQRGELHYAVVRKTSQTTKAQVGRVLQKSKRVSALKILWKIFQKMADLREKGDASKIYAVYFTLRFKRGSCLESAILVDFEQKTILNHVVASGVFRTNAVKL